MASFRARARAPALLFVSALGCGRSELGRFAIEDVSHAGAVGGVGATGGSAATGGLGATGGTAAASGTSGRTGGGGAGGGVGGAGGSSTGAAGAAGRPGPGPTPIQTTPPDGSFDLVFDAVFVDGQRSSAPIERHGIRVDLFENEFGLQAIVTPRWGDPEAFDVLLQDNSLILQGSVRIPEKAESENLVDTLGTIDVGLDLNGQLILGRGVEGRATELDTSLPGERTIALTLEGTILRDFTPPEMRDESRSLRGPADALLPWDPIVLRAAEPTSAALLYEGLILSPEEIADGRVETLFSYAPVEAERSARGVTLLTGNIKRWDGLLEGGDLTVWALPEVITDFSDNSLAPDFRIPIAFTHLGVPVSNHTFVRDEEVARYGHVTAWPFPPPGDRPCEASTCIQIGPVPDGECEARSGIAGILSTFSPAGDRYRIDYSVLSAEPWPDGAVAFEVETATVGNFPTVTRVLAADLVDLGTDAGELRYGSGPLSVEIPYPSGLEIPGFIGFGISVGGELCNDAPRRYSVIIDYIEQ